MYPDVYERGRAQTNNAMLLHLRDHVHDLDPLEHRQAIEEGNVDDTVGAETHGLNQRGP